MKACRIHPGTVSAGRLSRHATQSVLLVVLALFASTVPTAAQSASHRLANGLDIIVIHATTPSLTVVTRYFAGSGDEPDSLRGLAHLVEHLAMREASGGTALAVLAARNGWSVGAFTRVSVTTFSMTSPVADSATLAAMLRLERSRMSDLAMDSAAVTVERRRIATEIGTYFIDLIQDNYGVRRTGFFDLADNFTWHGAHIRFAVPTNFRFVAHATQTHPDVFTAQRFGN